MDKRNRKRADESDAEPCTSAESQQRALYASKIRESSEAIQKGDFQKAVKLYTEALALTPHNYILYSNRSATYIKLGQPDKALKDARKAKELNPKWPKGYYREGVALQCLGRVADALASYTAGLVQDPNNSQLLHTLQQTCLQSPLKERFRPLLNHLQKMKLDRSPFVTVSVIGQELLAAGYYSASVTVLESALRIGSCSIKLRGSVFSALSTAHWALGNIDKAIACMQQDLAIAKSLADQEGECRAHGNLGAAYFSKGNYREALQHHRFQLVVAMRLKQTKTASSALSSLGHVYTAIRDYPNALASHKQCAFLVKQTKNKLQEAKEIGNMGAVFLAMGDFDKALECHNEHLKIAKSLNNKVEEARAYSNMGSAYHYKRDYKSAIAYHNMVLSIATELGDRTLEARAYAGLGHATRCMQDYIKAKEYHEKQLDNALQTKDKVAEGRACSNLGIIYHQLGEYDAALKLHKAHLQIAKGLGDRASQGRAYGNIGNAHSALKQYDLAVRFHKQELAISKEVCDRHSEAATHGNLAVAYQSLQMYDKAMHHYTAHLNLARELKDAWSEARALNNLGNYYSHRKDYHEAIPVYEQYLAVSQELQDVEGEGRACHKLGFVHYRLGNHKEAIRYYEQDLALARDQQDKTSMCHAYCNLGLAYKALGDYTKALECQRNFLSTAELTKNMNAKFLALGNIGDVLSKMKDNDEAVKMFNQQLALARQLKNRNLEAVAFSNLGIIHKKLKQYDKALGYHNQELTICQEINDVKGECKAHGSLGNIHVCLSNYISACRCYEEQLDRSRDLHDVVLEARAYGNLGITKMNMSHTSDAIGYFESQLALLEQTVGHQALIERGHAYCNLGNCYESLGDYEEAIKYYEQYLAITQSTSSVTDQEAAYRFLGNTHRSMGNLQQALVCFEKRLVIAHELNNPEATSSAYGELGCLHSILGNYEQAISCLQHQLQIAKEMGNRLGEGEAACGLGGVYQQMAEYDRALEYHNMDLNIAKELNNTSCQCRAYGNLGLTHESMGNLDDALRLQEKHLAIANETNDKVAKTLAYSSLGRIHHAQGDYQRAVQYLQQGLQVADQIQQTEDEAKIRHRLGLALWGLGDLEGAQTQLYAAIDLFESMRREAQFNSEYKLSLFDLQTASYQALQRVLVGLGHHDEALVVAERGRTRAFVDLLLERQSVGGDTWYSSLDSSPVTKEIILDTVTRQRAAVLYFSVAVGYLYSWLILPEKGIVKFHESAMNESDIGSDPEDTQSLKSFRSFSMSTASLLDNYVGQARESLGVESHLSSSRLSLSHLSNHLSETESEADDLWQQHLEEIGEKLNNERDHTGFLRMEKRNHVWNASSYSLSSLLSFTNGVFSNRNSSIRSRGSTISTSSLASKPALSALYELLIKPMECSLPPTAGHEGCKELILVLQGDLYLVPFALLKPCQTAAPLCERYNLLAVPSVRALQASQTLSKHIKYNPNCTGAVVIGNPKLQPSVVHTWQWSPIPATEHECRMVSEMMGCRSLTGANATKDNVLREIPNAELIHFATHVSWKLAAIVVSPGNFSTTSAVHGNLERMDLSDSSSDIVSLDGPSLSDIIITAADVLNTRLNAKLVVLSSGYSDDRAGRINTDGVVGLTRAFLAAGAQCILFSLWPVPDMASRMLMKTFYTAMLQGARASQALSSAMKTLQNSRQFSHPSNWACWLLIGSDVILSSKVALMGHALCELLKTPDKSREAMRVVLHLVEKSLQRIHHGQRKAMYTTQASIANKVGDVSGWRDLLTSVGFRLEPSTNDLPAAVFFPTFDPGDRLTQCSASLQALLGLPLPTLIALSKMIEHCDVGEMVMSLIRDASSRVGEDGSFQVPVNVRLWRAPGVHEFLASLGFDLVEVGKDEVILRVNKQANRRTLQFGLQSLVAVFDTQDAPRTLLLDSSSSMESLCSSSSATSTSNFSKGSTPPTSPLHKRKSFFNPSEVDKLPSAKVRQNTGKLLSNPHTVDTTDINIHLQHQNIIREKYSSPSGSDLSDVNMSDFSHAKVLSVDTGDGSCPEDLLDVRSSKLLESSKSRRQTSANRSSSKYDRNSKGYVYSTSASDSEEGVMAESNLSRAKSRSSQSVASQSSTLTMRSTGSSGFRRNRSRASTASVRSSASDRTLTCDSRQGSQETLVEADIKSNTAVKCGLADKNIDNLSDSGIHSKHTDTATDNSADNEGHDCHSVIQPLYKKKDANQLHEEYHLSDDLSETATNKSSAKQSPLTDPTAVARKVLAETCQQRTALEAVQRWSVQSLKEKYEDKVVRVGNYDSNLADSGKSAIQKQTAPSPSASFTTFKPSPAKANDQNKKTIPSEPNRPAPTLNKSPADAKATLGIQQPFAAQPALSSRPKAIMANSLIDGRTSYTCSPGERISSLAEVSFSQSELESDNELSVIEEESEGVSDINSSYNNSKLEARLRGLQMSNSNEPNLSVENTTENDVPWYEEGSPTLTEKAALNSSRLSSTPTPKTAKTVTFQDEVEMEILSQCSEMLDAPDCTIFETDLDQVPATEGKECEMFVDGDLTPTEELNASDASRQMAHDETVTNQSVDSDEVCERFGLESAIKHKPPDIPPPPTGYKPPPPYPGPRRQGSASSAISSHSGTDSNGPCNTEASRTSIRPSGDVCKWNTSLSPVDGLDLNSPQNLARMSKQFYNGLANSVNPSVRSSQVTEKCVQPNKPQVSSVHGWLKERSYDGSGALRSVNYHGHNPAERRYPDLRNSPQHHSSSSNGHLNPKPLSHHTSQPYHYPGQGQSYPSVSSIQQGQGHPCYRTSFQGERRSYPNADHLSRVTDVHPHCVRAQPGQGYPNQADLGSSRQRQEHLDQNWYRNVRDGVTCYDGLKPVRQKVENFCQRPNNGDMAGISDQQSCQSNGFSSPNSLSSHDSYAEMRSIFPGAHSPQSDAIPAIEKGTVQYGDTMLYASNC